MANVTPTFPVRAFPCSSFNVPANFTNRGTGNAGTTSVGVCAVLLGACGSATSGCCACTPGRLKPKKKKNRKPIPAHFTVRFKGVTPLICSLKNLDFLSGQGAAHFYLK